jgi:hypothetical protein
MVRDSEADARRILAMLQRHEGNDACVVFP